MDIVPEPSMQLDGDENLRERTARGVIVNSGFQIGFAAIGLLQRFAIAAFLTREEYGTWGLVLSTLITLSFLKQVGISDKYIQQDEPDQEFAFQKAFTLELVYTTLFCVVIAVLLPLYALAYGRSEILLPSLVLALALLATGVQAPFWIFYRRMQFVRQRVLEAINPVLSMAVTLGLAIAGAGYWSLVIGMLVGSWTAAIVALIACPYRLALRIDRGTLREYVGFSWPLLLAGGSGMLIVQGTLMIGNYTVGLAGIGAIALASSLAVYGQRVDDVIGRTIYPAVCAVKDRRETLFETFSKSNRLVILWGLPFGAGMALFAPDLVDFVLGTKWEPAVALLQTIGLLVGLNQIGVSWNLFNQAVGDTRPVAVSGIVALVTFALVTAPCMILFGLTGYLVGMSVNTGVQIMLRAYYLRRLFPEFRPIAHLFRGIAPTLPGVGAVLLLRLAYSGDRTFALAVTEFAVYLVITLAATVYFERGLLAEIAGYLRRARSQADSFSESTAGLPA